MRPTHHVFLRFIINNACRAVQYNDAKKIYYQMTFIYEKANQYEQARQMCEKCCDKYPESQKVSWSRVLRSRSHEHVEQAQTAKLAHQLGLLFLLAGPPRRLGYLRRSGCR